MNFGRKKHKILVKSFFATFAGFLALSSSFSAHAESFTFSNIEKIIGLNGANSIPDLISHLPEELRENYTLMHESRSLHGASPKNPRAILFTRDGRFILTFNGDPALRGYETIETMEFKGDRNSFEFRQIDFSGSKPKISEANPKLCKSCHGHSPKPIWESYPNWAGAFGSNHDSFLAGPEFDGFVTYVQSYESHERYKHLIRHTDLSVNFPYQPPEEKAEQHRLRPNNRLGKFLMRLQAKHIAQEVLESPFFKARKNLVLGWLIGCSELKVEGMIDFLLSLPEAKSLNKEATQEALAQIEALPDKISYLMSALTTPQNPDWNISLMGNPKGARSQSGDGSIDFHVAAELLNRDKSLAKEIALVPYSIFYDALVAPGCFAENVAPGNIGDIYDSLGLLFDPKKNGEACKALAESPNAFGLPNQSYQ